MAKLPNKKMRVFGEAGETTDFAQFGSLAANNIAYTKDPELAQSLPNYLNGWRSAVIGQNAPTIEDMNALFHMITYQIAYLKQQGVAEWDEQTTYHIGSLVSLRGILYYSIVNNNLNDDPLRSDSDAWEPLSFRDNSIIGAKLRDATVTLQKMAANSVDTVQLINRAVTNAKIALNAIENEQMAANSVRRGEIQNNEVTLAKLNTDTTDRILIKNLPSGVSPPGRILDDTLILASDESHFLSDLTTTLVRNTFYEVSINMFVDNLFRDADFAIQIVYNDAFLNFVNPQTRTRFQSIVGLGQAGVDRENNSFGEALGLRNYVQTTFKTNNTVGPHSVKFRMLSTDLNSRVRGNGTESETHCIVREIKNINRVTSFT